MMNMALNLMEWSGQTLKDLSKAMATDLDVKPCFEDVGWARSSDAD